MISDAASGTRLGTHVSTSVGGETVRAFVPSPLPPDPPLAITPHLQDLIEKANRGLGRLDGVARIFPDPALFLYMYVRKEALLSSQIEGTQSSFSDLLLFEAEEAPGAPLDDVEEVSHYVAAMNHALERLRGGFPLSLRLIRETHGILLSGGRGANKMPGEFRTSQNWIGGSRPGNAAFVPPPPNRVIECMGLLEKFLHDDPVRTPLLIKAALAHVQFETIHPFLDGNGRVGRLLITLLLCADGALAQPLLYLSLYFKTHRDAYYSLLQRVRSEGAWEDWLDFFLAGVIDTTEQATRSAQRIIGLFHGDRERVEKIGRASASALRLHQVLQEKVMLSIPGAAKRLGLSQPTVTASMRHLEQLGIVRERTGRRRNRMYVYDAYLKILEEGAEPIR
ncbi:MAG: Fic family protein [Burkholderiales bacterium]|nr:Fic family protein [Burkholderiales bacterium]